MSTQPLKIEGEDLAARLLVDKGWQIVARNWRCKIGELDIVALDGGELIFVEVKARRSAGFGGPVGAVTFEKRRRIRKLAEVFIAWERPTFETCRFDIVAIVFDGSGGDVEHLVDAF